MFFLPKDLFGAAQFGVETYHAGGSIEVREGVAVGASSHTRGKRAISPVSALRATAYACEFWSYDSRPARTHMRASTPSFLMT